MQGLNLCHRPEHSETKYEVTGGEELRNHALFPALRQSC